MVIISDYRIAMAAGQDAGNQHMRRHGRRRWNEADYAEATRVYNNVMGSLATLPVKGSA